MAQRAITPINVILMVILITFWGSSFVVVRILEKELTPIAIATFRFLTAGAFFLVSLASRRLLNPNYHLTVQRRDLLVLLALSLSGVTFFFIAQYTGIQMANASIAAILVCLLSPVLITVLSARLFKEHLTKRQLFGVSVAMLGTLFVVSADLLSLQSSTVFLVGTLILLLTPILWALYSLLGKKLMEKYDPFLVVAYVNVLGGLLLVPFSLGEQSFLSILDLGTSEWLAILYLSFTCSLLGYYIWFYVLKKSGASASSFLFAEPLITVFFAMKFINETLNVFVLLGAFLIFIGVYFVTRYK